MIQILTTTAWVLSFLFTLYFFYYLCFSAFSLKRHPSRPERAPEKRFAVVVAARNEECVIGQLVESLYQQNYPRELYDVIVAPNNCTDHTREAALAAGARVFDCTYPVKSKGDVLRQVFQWLLDGDGYDAVCVFDADNLVHPDFLRGMNNALCDGARAAQGYRDSKNPYDTWVSGCYSIYYWMVNRFYNQTRSVLGLSAMVNGSGFMVSTDLLREMGGWHTVTMTEDIEFTTQCILRGEKVAWVPEAVIYDEQPLTFRQSWKQRKRWSTGILQGFSTYFKPLARAAVRERRFCCVDQMLFFIAPFMQLVYVASLVVGLALDLMYIQHQMFPATAIYYRMFVSVNTSFITSLALSLVVLFLEKKGSPRLLKGAVTYWFFVLSWVPINVLCFFRKTTRWEEIKHTRSVRLADTSPLR